MEKRFFEKPAVYVETVSLRVTDLARSIHFYSDFMGFQLLEETERKAVLTVDGSTPLLELQQPEGIKPKQGRTAGLYHFAILLPSRKDLGAFLNHLLKTTDYQLRLGASDHYVSEALYFQDPDGNGIEVARDRPSEEWGWKDRKVSMGTEALDGNGLMVSAEGEWAGMPAGTLMGHIHLHVSDLEKAKTTYMDGIGMELATDYPGALFLATNGYHHHIAVNIWNGTGAPKPETDQVGMNWFSLRYPDKISLEKTVQRLKENNEIVEEIENGYAMEDSSGIRIHMIAE